MNRPPSIVRLASLLIIAALLLGVPTISLAESNAPAQAAQSELSTPQLLDKALTNGEITAEQRILYLAYAIYDHASLPPQFRSEAGWSGTEYVREIRAAWQTTSVDQKRLAALTLRELQRLLAPSAATICAEEDGPNNDSTSPNFYINYGTINGTLTIADYRNTLDSAFATEITGYGWAQPPVCDATCTNGAPPDGKYPVQIAPLGGGLYGYVTAGGGLYAGYVLGNNPNTPETETASVTSCMVLRNDSYATLGGLNGLRVTSAHEYKHAIQNGYGDPAPTEDLMWLEGDAAYTEDEVWDAINDNYQYLWPDWTQCLGEWPSGAPSYPEYSSWLLFRYAAEHNGGANVAGGGEDVVQGVWQNIAAGQSGLNALNTALGVKTPGATLADTFHRYAIASRFEKACPASAPYCYEEAASYVAPRGVPANHGSIAAIGSTYTGSIRDNYAINWVGLPTTGGPYNVTLSNTSAGGQLRSSIVADPTGDRTGTLAVASFPTVINTGESRSVCYTPPGSPNGVVAVITNQAQTEANPGTCTAHSYTVSVSPASNIGSASSFPAGATVDIGCGTYVKARLNSGDPGTVSVTKHAQAPGGNPAGAGEMPIHWTISATGGIYDMDLTLCYTDAELAAAGADVTEDNLSLYRYEGSGPWTLVGADVRDPATNCVTKRNVTAFSSWTLGGATPTAIGLESLAAGPTGSTNAIALSLPLAVLGITGSLLIWKRRRSS
ncbi:MAG: hypothetical protein HY870_02580 [Chloroflexi bacterium]|nr:hypothetical protein [Chloroflexota bacterium]